MLEGSQYNSSLRFEQHSLSGRRLAAHWFDWFDWFVTQGLSFGTVDYLDDGDSAHAKQAPGRAGTSTTPLICMIPFSSPSSFPVE